MADRCYSQPEERIMTRGKLLVAVGVTAGTRTLRPGLSGARRRATTTGSSSDRAARGSSSESAAEGEYLQLEWRLVVIGRGLLRAGFDRPLDTSTREYATAPVRPSRTDGEAAQGGRAATAAAPDQR